MLILLECRDCFGKNRAPKFGHSREIELQCCEELSDRRVPAGRRGYEMVGAQDASYDVERNLIDESDRPGCQANLGNSRT